MKSTLAEQREAVEQLIWAAGDGPNPPPQIALARDACRTLAWFERRQELTRALVDLDKRAPGLASLAEAFPGSSIRVEGADGQ